MTRYVIVASDSHGNEFVAMIGTIYTDHDSAARIAEELSESDLHHTYQVTELGVHSHYEHVINELHDTANSLDDLAREWRGTRSGPDSNTRIVHASTIRDVAERLRDVAAPHGRYVAVDQA